MRKRKRFLLMIAVVMTAVFFGCDDTTGNEGGNEPATTPATKVTITAVDGTDFGNVSLGNEVTKKFQIKMDGYIGSWSYSLPIGFESPDLENLLKSLEETAGTTGEFSVTFSPLFNGKSSDDIVIITDMMGGAEGTLAVTADGSGTKLKAPDALDKTLTVTYAYRESDTGDLAIDKGANSLDLNPSRNVGVITVTADYYVEDHYSRTSTGDINYKYEAFPNDPSQLNSIVIVVTANPLVSESKESHFSIEGEKISIKWSPDASSEM